MKTFRKIWNLLTTLLVVVVVLLAVALVGVRLAGYKTFTVLSGSMEPTYHTGSLIYVKEVDYKTLKAGDPITFMIDENTAATHRIIEVIPDAEEPDVLRFVTKGDANENPDGSTVHYKNIIGKPVFTIPYLGFVADYIQHPPGTYITIAACAVILLLAFIPDLFDEEETEEGKKKPEDEAQSPPEDQDAAAGKQ